ncbi:MAG: site-specific DNA-methyltransferase [Chloroherpetonaceae bacterium]
MNQLILGDCLEVMRKMDSESIDLIYLDPPFFSNRNYEVIWGDKGEVRSFEDRWSGGIDHYISWLKERVQEMYRLLKPTGSIYLHCDWHANAEIKVYILNKIFGDNNFRGEIIWQRTNAHNDAKKKLAVLTDTIWYYTKSDKFSYNPVYGEFNEKYLKDFYKYEDEKGRYRLDNIANPKPGGYIYDYKDFKPPTNGWRFPVKTMIERDNAGLINFPSNINGRLSFKRYLSDKGTLIGNIWTDIGNVQGSARIGYPTQKPEALLDRIIKMSSNEGDTILDPFVGGGTTVVVADKLNRNWIGIDQSVQAIKVSEFRLNKQQGLYSAPFVVQLHKYDYDTLFNQNPKIFETWIVERFGGRPNMKKGSDKGIDGKMQDGTPIQVKQSNAVGSMPIRQLITDARANDKMVYEKNILEGKPIAYFIAFSFGKGAIQEVARLKNEENIIIKLVTVEEIVPIAKKPKLNVSIKDLGADGKGHREIEFTAEAESETEIEFFAFDFDYNEETKIFSAEEILNKDGKATNKFKAGTHTIAIKVIDSEGLEAMEVIKIKVNGEVERE